MNTLHVVILACAGASTALKRKIRDRSGDACTACCE